jgi:hypothetical protein
MCPCVRRQGQQCPLGFPPTCHQAKDDCKGEVVVAVEHQVSHEGANGLRHARQEGPGEALQAGKGERGREAECSQKQQQQQDAMPPGLAGQPQHAQQQPAEDMPSPPPTFHLLPVA